MAALAIAALLPVVNPPGCAPVFLSLTPGASDATRTLLARRLAINGVLLLVAAMLIGSYVLGFFGLSLSVVKIAGGLLVIATGWRLLNSEGASESASMAPKVAWAADEMTRRSFYPLTFPLTVGPGSLSVALTLGAGTRGPDVSVVIGVAGAVTGHCRRRAGDLPVLPLCRQCDGDARRDGHGRALAPVGVHPARGRGGDSL